MTKQTDIADRDLMALFDDEVDEAEIEALEAALEAQESARDKLAGLGLVQELIREQVDGDDRADGIADAVMARLEADAPELQEAPLMAAPVTAAPANDNSRTIWTLAAAAAAVAAGLFVWGNGATEAEPTALGPAPPALETPAATMEPAPETLGEVAEGPGISGGGEDEDAVEFAQLDYGNDEHTGSIFKVDNENTGVHTAVVWVTDLGADE